MTQTHVTADELAANKRIRSALLAQARNDPVAFASYVLKDEETNRPIKLRDTHIEWHDLIDAHKRLLIWGHVESGKSTQISVGRTIYELGLNPNLRCVVVSQGDGQAKKITGLISKLIRTSPELHQVFPHLQPDDDALWNQHEMFVKRDTKAKDPSITSIGMRGKIQGARIDWLILDDILGHENVQTQGRRDMDWSWVQSELLNRVTPNGKVIVVGNAWHRDDVMHRLSRMNGSYYCVKYPLLDQNGDSTWPERWPLSRIIERRREIMPLEFARMFQCQAHSDDAFWFSREWIETCVARGSKLRLLNQLGATPHGYQIFTGVDLSTGKKDSDLTVLFTIAVLPNGDRQVLMIESGRWDAPTILEKIKETYGRYRSIFIVEDNASQIYIQQMLAKTTGIPVRPYTTTAKTHAKGAAAEFGMSRLATEMANGKWLIPSSGGVHREVQEWMAEMVQYDGQSHPGDRLMASLFASEGPNYRKPVGRIGRLNLVKR